MEKQVVEVLSPDVGSLIYMVRNKQVMVDSDLAMLYQVETKALNRAVKRNAKRFPEDFCFQLTAEELKILRCQSGTAKLKEAETEDGPYHMYLQNRENLSIMVLGFNRSDLYFQTIYATLWKQKRIRYK